MGGAFSAPLFCALQQALKDPVPVRAGLCGRQTIFASLALSEPSVADGHLSSTQQILLNLLIRKEELSGVFL